MQTNHSNSGNPSYEPAGSLMERLLAESVIAKNRVYELDQPTPIISLPLAIGNLWLKREDISLVHSYKWRGAFNKIKSLHESGFRGALVAASAGNHAQGVAISAARLKLLATIFMPRSTPLLKQESVKQFGGSFVEIRLRGDTFEEAATHAREFADQSDGIIIPPYDDVLVMAGQSTIGWEIIEASRLSAGGQDEKNARRSDDEHSKAQASNESAPTHVFLPIGGGGMAAGVAAILRSHFPKIKLIGVEAEHQASMKLSIERGQRTKIDYLDRFCDGTAVAIPGEMTFEICRQVLDEVVTVTNDEVCEAIQYMWQRLRLIVEPSAGLGVAAALQMRFSKTDRPLTVLSGSNVDFMTLPKIAMRGQAVRPETRYYAFEIDEQPGALVRLLDQFEGNMNIIDFQYGQVAMNMAYPVIGIEVPHNAIEHLEEFLQSPSIPPHTEVTGSAASEFRVIPFNVDLLKLPFFAVIEFPNRPGALRDFMHGASRLASVCYMNFMDTGQTEGQAMMGFDFVELARQSEFFEWLEVNKTQFQVINIEVVKHFTGSKIHADKMAQDGRQPKSF